jgi:hypothetical protein
MTVTLNLPAHVEQAYLAEAQAKGVPLDELVRDVLLSLQPPPVPVVSELPPDEWIRKFRAWAHSHRTDTPLLSEEAISRDSIYSERGL